MSKYFFFIIATLFFQGGVIAMDQPRTPRQPISEKNTPAQKAFLLNEAINNYDFKLTRFILRQNFDPNGVSYSPAIILYEICRGNLEKSPFNSKEDWDQCQGGVIDKKAFKATALFLVD